MENSQINKTYLIILLGILAALGPLTIDMYIPGFSNIAEEFNTTENQVAFTMTSYFMGISLGQLVYGPLVDKYGRKKPLQVGLIIYLIAALGCALSYSIEMMIGLRFFQALGGSAGMVAATAIITDVYKPDDRARAFSLIMLVMGIAPVLAPSFGSFFVEYLNWESIFYFLAFFSGLVSLLIFFFLPETSVYTYTDKLKIKRIAKDYKQVIKNKTFFLYTMGGSIANSMLFAYIASASFIFLTYYGLDKKTFSILFAINALGMISGSYINGWVSRWIRYIKILNVSAVIMVLFTFIFAVWAFKNPNLPFEWVVVGIFGTNFLIGFTYPNAIAASLAPFTKRSGSASALSGGIRMAIGSLVTAIIGVFTASSAFTMFAIMSVLSLIAFIILRIAKRYAP